LQNVLGDTSERLRKFNKKAVFNIIGNNYHYSSSSVQFQCTFNPINLVEGYEENKKHYQELLQSEREKIEILK